MAALDNLRRWRRHHDVSQAELAEAMTRLAGVPCVDSQVSRYETGARTDYTVPWLEALADTIRALHPEDPMTLDQLRDRAPWDPPAAAAPGPLQAASG